MNLKKTAFEKSGNNENYLQRLEIEFKEIEKAGMWSYFEQLVSSERKFHNDKSLLCAYLWEICPENPMENNEDLVWCISTEMPDMDIDFTPESRSELKKYCIEKFGSDKVVSIANYNTFGIKSGIRDICRLYEIPLDEVNKYAKPLGNDVNSMEWDQAKDVYPVLKEFENKYPEIAQIVRHFDGRTRSIGMHAGGIIISSESISDTIPFISRKDKDTEQKMFLSSFSEGQKRSDIKTFGFVKQDMLGLENLNYIQTCLKFIEKKGQYNPEKGIFRTRVDDRDWTDESYLEDKESLQEANKGNLLLVFQFDSPGMREAVKKCGVSSFNDLVDMTSLYRPGPKDSLMLEEYIERKNGRKKFSIHPLLQTILGKTYGVIVYQEELMRVMNTAGLISLQDCEIIRKAMSQKKEDVFMKYKTVFIENGQKTLKWSKEDVEDLWNQMYTFSKYGFNLSHAASYTIVSFRCLWLKTHYPTEYYAAVLSHLQTGDDRVPIYIQDGIEKKNLEFKGVDIDKSKTGYTIEENNIIRIGFDKIKGITKEAHKLIELQPFKSFEDYIERFGCGKTTGERLIKLGAFDNFYKNRKKLLYYLEYIRNSQKASYGMNTNHFRKAYKTINGTKSCPKENSEYFKEVRDKINKNKSSSISYDDIVKIITDGIFDQHIERNTFLEYVIDNKSEFEERITTFDQFEDCEDFSSKERSSFESELYGVSLSDPLDDYRKPENSNIDFIKENGFGKVAVIITGIEQKLSKKKTKYYIMDIKDRTGFMKVTLWENEYIRFSNLLKSGECILIDVVAPKNEFWPWNMQKYGVIKRIRLKNEISEEEEREITYSEEFKKSLSGE